MESPLVVELNQTLERTTDDNLVHGELMLSVVGDLEQHGAYQVAAIEDGQVDLHVEGNLSLVFFQLILRRLLLIAGVALCKQLFVLSVVADVHEQVMGLIDAS